MSLNNDASLILHLKLDEVAGVTTAVNAANPGTYDGTVAGGATIDYAKGKYRNGITRTDAGDNISCGAVSELAESRGFCYREATCCWLVLGTQP